MIRTIALAALAAIGVVILVAMIAGAAPGEIAAALIGGSIGSRFALIDTILRSVPLILTGVAVLIAFRAGAWNIGAEGQFIVGGLAAAIAAQSIAPGAFASAAALAAGAVAGALWAGVAALMRVYRQTPEVLTTILLNFIAIHLLGFAVNGPLQEAAGRYPQSEAVPLATTLGRFAPRLHAGIVLAAAAPLAAWWFLYRTHSGLRLRSTGFNPSAARFAGVDTAREIIRAMALSGAVAGLSGAIELLGVTGRLYERFASGVGYAGIAVALLAMLQPMLVVPSAIFFAVLATGAGDLQRTAGVSASVATLAQGTAILVLVLLAKRPVAGRTRQGEA